MGILSALSPPPYAASTSTSTSTSTTTIDVARSRHGRRRAALRALTITMARDPRVVGAVARVVRVSPTRGAGRGERLARIAAVFSFVAQYLGDPATETPATAPIAVRDAPRDGFDVLARLAGPDTTAAVILAALLRAAGERAELEYTREAVIVRVFLEPWDLPQLPPHAAVLRGCDGKPWLPLAPRHARAPLGFLPRSLREALARRRGSAHSLDQIEVGEHADVGIRV